MNSPRMPTMRYINNRCSEYEFQSNPFQTTAFLNKIDEIFNNHSSGIKNQLPENFLSLEKKKQIKILTNINEYYILTRAISKARTHELQLLQNMYKDYTDYSKEYLCFGSTIENYVRCKFCHETA